MTSGSTFDVAVIGGGIVGCACAAEFAREGMRVVVIERDMIGGGATAAGMGHIVVMDDSEAQFALTRYSQRLWREFLPELPPSIEYQSTGTIWVAADEEEMREVIRKHNFYEGRAVPSEILDSKAFAQAEPNLRPGLAGGLLVPQDAVLYPPTAASFFLRAANCDLVLRKSVTQIQSGCLKMNDGTSISAGVVVNATGTWAPELSPEIEVAPRKGHLVITDRYPGFAHHQLIELGYLKSAHSTGSDSVAFNVQPRPTGQLLIGSSRQYGETSVTVDQDILSRMLNRALEYMPGLAKVNAIRSWTGFRAATPDKLPLIGPTELKGVYLASGHEGLGITTSLATARLLADQVLGRKPAIAVEPYLPSRSGRVQSHA